MRRKRKNLGNPAAIEAATTVAKTKAGQNTIMIATVAGVVAAGYLIWKFGGLIGGIKDGAVGIAEGIGLKDSDVDKAVKNKTKEINQTPAQQNPWSPQYYRSNGGSGFTASMANALAEKIYKAVRSDQGGGGSVFNSSRLFNGNKGSNADVILGVLRQLKTKVQLSMLADAFVKRYNKDIYTFLDKANTNEYVSKYLDVASGLKGIQWR